MASSSLTTPGQLLLRSLVPEDITVPDSMDKKSVSGMFQELAEKHPDKYVDVLKALNDEARFAATTYGREASIGLSDFETPPKTFKARELLKKQINQIAQSKQISAKDKNEKIVALLRDQADTLRHDAVSEAADRGSSLALAAKHGFRGNTLQASQLLYGDVLLADHKGRPVPIPGLHGYAEGVTPMEYWAGSYGARKGAADVQFATARTGFLSKQMSYMAQRLRVTGDDCHAKTGVFAKPDDAEIIGYTLARETAGMPAGTPIDRKNIGKLAGEDKVMVRSITTCQMPEGVCKLCAGKREDHKYPPLGSYLGITSARVMSEPWTQSLGLSAKHLGGTVSSAQSVTGLDEIQQFLNVPENFRGKSILAPEDGHITSVQPAPQGGAYVFVGSKQNYVPAGVNLLVKKGDKVEAGDMLSEGTPHPAEMAKYKGLGAARNYFVEKFGEILRNNGVPAHRRHLETISRAFYDRVLVTDPDGISGYEPGEEVSYTDIARKYKPRSTAVVKSPVSQTGRYLEVPTLHYTIGTRITPSVAKNMIDSGVQEITADDNPPGFEPEVMRMMDIPATDPDWKVKLSGFYLKKSLLDSVQHGSTSQNTSTSYVPQLMNPTLIVKRG